jgi:phosphoribosylformylglycinamidine (FGAM) synthase PurS component
VSERTIAISLKIPDNAAYTALTALRRLGVSVDRLERSDVWRFDDAGDPATLGARIQANEGIFNPNKHRLTIVDTNTPRAGEAWIYESDAHAVASGELGGKGIAGVSRAHRYSGWRLLDTHGAPVARETLAAAVERLLCNPAIEEALF